MSNAARVLMQMIVRLGLLKYRWGHYLFTQLLGYRIRRGDYR